MQPEEIIENEVVSCLVFPQPAKEFISFKTTGFEKVNLAEIYDINGRCVLKLKGGTDLSTIDISSLQTGIFFLRIESGRGE